MNGKISQHKSKLLMGVYVLGIVIGLVAVILGICTIKGKFRGNADTVDSPSFSVDYGYATFGTDFYTYLNNNTAYAAFAGRQTAYNLYTISNLLKNAFGIFLMTFGGFTVCLFSGKFVETVPDKAPGTRAKDVEAATAENIQPAGEQKDCT